MKLLFATLLSLTLLLPSLGSMVIFTQFKMAQEQIAKTICVQRANINNSCNGRCELQKSLKKYEDNEKRMDNTNLKEKTELVYTAAKLEYTVAPLTLFQEERTTTTHFCQNPIKISFAIFHPPLV
ncbi:hypothetical protein SLW70_13805 [Flavobacterium sp. NG2]|uniref:hypothetical protein n=1 Tax=Flavobacterium sp. NG2 TaxID=3097547 RepID=UPI002A82BF63|nr:hypothetical protein [Flavobacterium sp. NG2]WPR70998.1 hypothetical protein SLW70_13805 [Flavobacterium sp. NG2]